MPSVQSRSGLPLSYEASNNPVQRPDTADIPRGEQYNQRYNTDRSKAIAVLSQRLTKDHCDSVRHLRRKILVRAHGLGHSMEAYTDQAYEPTSMRRRR